MNNLDALLADHDSDLFNALDCDCCVYRNGEKVCIYDFDMCERGTREWLLSEHVDDESCRQDADQPKRQESPVCESDSREKLEAEIDDWCAEHFNSSFSGKAFNLMLRWLDRQAAITERETEKKWSCFSDSAGGHITELTEQLESAHAKNRALKAHIAKMQEGRHGWHIKGKELQKEADMLKKQLETAQDVNERQDLEYVSLAHEIGTLRAERDRYRELCSKLLDAADDMRRVRDAFDQFDRGEA